MSAFWIVALAAVIFTIIYLASEKLLKRLSKECRKEYGWLSSFVHRVYCAEQEGCPFRHFYSRLIWLLCWVLLGISIDRLLVYLFS